MSFYSGKLVKEPTKKASKILPVLLFLIVALCFAAYFVLTSTSISEKLSLYRCYWDISIVTTSSATSTGSIPVTIQLGQDPLAVGKLLKDKGIIANANDFLCYVSKIEAGDKIQAGYYEIKLPVTLEQLVPLLQNSQIPTVRITLQEGLRMDEIAAKLDTAMGTDNPIKVFSREEFLQLIVDKTVLSNFVYTKNKTSLEGFLFPDTYEFTKNATTTEVLDTLLKTFTRKVSSETDLDASTELTPYQVVVLASLIEKEAGKSFEEKQTIAGILLKRMKNNWLLQVDAAFLYEKKDWKASIYADDKLSDSLYNTYRRKGLPPTPIDNPGLDSIKSVLTPKQSPYWFYLHGLDGVVRYAKTNDEHLKNISLYLR